MKILHKTMSVLLGFLVFMSSVPLAAQEAGVFGLHVKLAQTHNSVEKFMQAVKQAAFVRQADMTAQEVMRQCKYMDPGYVNGYVDGELLTAVLSDEAYVTSLGLEEATALVYCAQFVKIRDASWAERLSRVVLGRLGDYNEDAADFPVQAFYAAVAVSLGQNLRMWRFVEDWAFGQMELAANPSDAARRGWAADVLAKLASRSVTVWEELAIAGEAALEDSDLQRKTAIWSDVRRKRFERRLESLISKFDWLQNVPTDYKMTGVKNALGTSNQGALLQLFAQANSFFSMKDDDGFLKQMISAGGLNPVGRAIAGRGQGDRFSDTGENFYLHSPTPGTDGKGRFASTLNGRRHFILSSLIYALFLSYNTRHPWQESSLLMQQFVRRYLAVDADSHFVHYLYIPLMGMRLGMAIHNNSTLDGWEKEEAALQGDLYGKLKKGYPWNVICSSVQGACEVTVEWVGLGKVFGWVFRGLGWGVKAAGRQTVKHMSPRMLMNLALVQIAAGQGKKAVISWSKQSIKALLGASGWKKVVSVGTGAALLHGDGQQESLRQGLAR